jgi:hypothetical protein
MDGKLNFWYLLKKMCRAMTIFLQKTCGSTSAAVLHFHHRTGSTRSTNFPVRVVSKTTFVYVGLSIQFVTSNKTCYRYWRYYKGTHYIWDNNSWISVSYYWWMNVCPEIKKNKNENINLKILQKGPEPCTDIFWWWRTTYVYSQCT